MKPIKGEYYIAISRCPHGVLSITLDDEGGGIKLVPTARCCGRWNTVKQWPVTAAELRNIVIDLENAIEDLEK